MQEVEISSRSGEFGRLFLARPGRFPTGLGGEPWGDRSLALEIASETFLFTGLDNRRAELLSERFAPYARPPDEASAGVITRVYRTPETDFEDVDPQTLDTSLEAESFPGGVRLAGLGLVGLIETAAPPEGPAGSRVRAGIWLPEACDAYLYMAFENTLRGLLAYRLCELGGALVHSAAVVHGGLARVCFGHSGAGKSTLSRLAHRAGLEVLSDDFNAVRPVADGFRVSQVPYAGDFGRNAPRTDDHPLGGIYRLLQGPTAELRPLRPGRAVAGLLACCPFVNGDPPWRERALSNLARAVGQVPIGTLVASLSADCWELL